MFLLGLYQGGQLPCEHQIEATYEGAKSQAWVTGLPPFVIRAVLTNLGAGEETD